MAIPNPILEIIRLLLSKTSQGEIDWNEHGGWMSVPLSQSTIRVLAQLNDTPKWGRIVVINAEGRMVDNQRVEDGDSDYDMVVELYNAAHEHVYKTEATIRNTINELRDLDSFGDEVEVP